MTSTEYWQPPFYIYFLSLIYRIFGQNLLIAKIIQGLIGAATTALTYYLGKSFFNKTTGMIAGIIAVFYLPMVFFNCELLTPVLETFFGTLLLLLLSRYRKRRNIATLATAGIILGILVITRPTFGILIPIIWIYLIQILANDSRPLKISGSILLFTLCMIFTVSPVTIRNYRINQRFVPVSTNGGINFYIGNNEKAEETIAIRPGWEWHTFIKEPSKAGYYSGPDKSAYYYRKSFDYISANPGGFLKGLMRKSWLLLSSREIPRNVDIYSFRDYSILLRIGVWRFWGFGFPGGLLFPFALIGMIVSLGKRPEQWLLPAYILAIGFSIVLFFVASRYRIPIIPPLLVMSSLGIIKFWTILKEAQTSKRLQVLGLLAACFLAVNLPRTAPTDNVHFKAEILRMAGREHMEIRKMEQAEELTLESLRLEPDTLDSISTLALIYFRSNRVPEAERIWQNILERYPEFPEAHLGLGQIAITRRQYATALPHLEQALRFDPEYENAHYNRAIVLMILGRFREAYEAFKLVLLYNPDFRNVNRYLGVLASRQGIFHEAVIYYQRAIEEDPEDPELLNNFAFLLACAHDATIRDGRHAVELAKKACELTDYSSPYYLDTLASAYAEVGDFQQAIKYSKMAIEAIEDAQLKIELEKNLKLLESGKPIRMDTSLYIDTSELDSTNNS